MTGKQLRPDQVHRVGVAALVNAIDLISEADLLLKAGKVRRAYALAVFGVEEAAKFLLCKNLLLDWRGSPTVVELNNRLRPPEDAHVRRFADFLDHLRSLDPRRLRAPNDHEDFVAMAKKTMRARRRALYVEVAYSGDPMTPGGVDEDSMTAWLGYMIWWFDRLAPVWERELGQALAQALAREG